METQGIAVAIVPAYEESARIGATVASLLALDEVGEVVVVDDGSRDDTGEVARRAGATVISLAHNGGKGRALAAGVRLLLSREGRPAAVLFADADLDESARHLGALLEPVLAGMCDLAIADLPPQRGAAGFGLVVKTARAGLRLLTGRSFSEPLSGQRAVSGRALPWLLPFGPGFGAEVAMTIAAVEAGLEVLEIPVPLTHAPTGRNLAGILHRAAQARDVGRVLLSAASTRLAARRRSRRRPRPALPR